MAFKWCLFFNNHFAYYAFTKNNMFKLSNTQNLFPKPGLRDEPFAFTFNDCYFSYKFQGIMLNSGAIGIFSVSELQVLTLQKRNPTIQFNTLMAGSNRIRFSKGIITVKSVVQIPTPLGTIAFHILFTNTLFLLCL